MNSDMRVILNGDTLSVQGIPRASLMQEIVALAFAAGLDTVQAADLKQYGYRVNIALPEHQEATELSSLILVLSAAIMRRSVEGCIDNYKSGSNFDVEAAAAAPTLMAR